MVEAVLPEMVEGLFGTHMQHSMGMDILEFRSCYTSMALAWSK